MNQHPKPLPKTLFGFLGHFIKPAWPLFLLLLLMGLLWSLNQVLIPYGIKFIIDGLTKQSVNFHFQLFSWPILIIVGLWMIITLSGSSLIQLIIIPPFRARIRHQALAYTYQQSHRFFTDHLAGRIAQKLSDLPRSAEMLIQTSFFSFLPMLITFIMALSILWRTGISFAITLFIWGSIHLLTLVFFFPLCRTLAARHADSISYLTGQVVDSVTNIMNIRLFARHRFELDYFNKLQRNEIKNGRRALWANEVMKLIQAIIAAIMVITMLTLLYRNWLAGLITVGDFSLVTLLSINMLNLSWFLQFNLALFFREAGTIKSSLSLLNQPLEIADPPHMKPLIVTRGTIVFEQVDFSYQDNIHIFKSLSINLKGGEKVGIVGLSGAGKSTFVNLILRFYEVQAGNIYIDKQAINEVSQGSLHNQIGMIPQEVLLFHRNLMDNIRYGNIEASDQAVMIAAQQAQAHNFISKLPQGYDTLVGERGVKLSGGQRQRIAIARAILKNAPILILDEATTALDSATEKNIQQALRTVTQNRTTIAIAHRLSTLLMMDRILVFHQGQLVEDGTHNQLLTKKGYYAKLWQLQSSGILPENLNIEQFEHIDIG